MEPAGQQLEPPLCLGPPAPGEAELDPADEELYQRACQRLATPQRGGWAAFVLTLALFWFAANPATFGARGAALLVAALLLHELGHLAAMALFGYRDLKVFFIPFLGAAASGRAIGVAPWKQAITLLAGPLPGVGLGLFFLFLPATGPHSIASQAAVTFLGLNSFNLLPLGFLDGGQLFTVLFFSGRPRAEAAFKAVTLALLTAVGLALESWIFAAACGFTLIAIPAVYRLARAAAGVRPLLAGERCEACEVPDEKRRALFRAARALLPPAAKDPAKVLALQMRQLYERATTPGAPIWQALGFAALWAAAFSSLLAALVLVSILRGRS